MMITTRRQMARLRLLAGLVLVGFVAGTGYRYLQWNLDNYALEPSLSGAGMTGALIAALVASVELVLLPSRYGTWLRRQPFLLLLVARTVLASLLITTGLVVGNTVLIGDDLSGQYLIGLQIFVDLAVAFGIMSVVLFVLQVRQIVGPRVLTAFVLGRYFRPVREERVFMFLDLCDSTALATRLGDAGVHALISEFFRDAGEIVHEFHGETHRYVGDQIVVTWAYRQGLQDGLCLDCVRAIENSILRHAQRYETRFGVVPAFRAGFHGGPVVAGECGEEKREIVYFGDTVNTAARVESMCKKLDQKVLLTKALLRDLKLPTGMYTRAQGAITLRGRDSATELHSLHW